MNQEAVNLLNFGVASTNVFDGVKKLSGADGRSASPGADDKAGSSPRGGAAATTDVTTLGGVPRRGAVGQLALHEAYKCYNVGERLKTPSVPVWLVFSESHYSVLWAAELGALERGGTGALDAKAEAKSGGGGGALELYYYDQLAEPREIIRLTLDLAPATPPPPSPGSIPGAKDEDEALVPPLDLVVRTRWPGAAVDWNGHELIL